MLLLELLFPLLLFLYWQMVILSYRSISEECSGSGWWTSNSSNDNPSIGLTHYQGSTIVAEKHQRHA
jgi:hypothetical protein